MPQREAGERVINQSHLCTQDHTYEDAHAQDTIQCPTFLVHASDSRSQHIPKSGTDYDGGRILNLYNTDIEYVHVMRAVVESHKLRDDCHPDSVNQATILAQQYHINKGTKISGDRGRAAVKKELKQLDDLEVVKPHAVDTLTWDQKKYALPCLMFLTENNYSESRYVCRWKQTGYGYE